MHGDAAARQWLADLKRNAQIFQNNTAILQAVDSGSLAVGLINYHYWFRLQAENGGKPLRAKLYYFGHQDPGSSG